MQKDHGRCLQGEAQRDQSQGCRGEAEQDVQRRKHHEGLGQIDLRRAARSDLSLANFARAKRPCGVAWLRGRDSVRTGLTGEKQIVATVQAQHFPDSPFGSAKQESPVHSAAIAICKQKLSQERGVDVTHAVDVNDKVALARHAAARASRTGKMFCRVHAPKNSRISSSPR